MLTVRDITIDPEFRDLIPAPTEDERLELAKSILQHGFRDRLVVWLNRGVLLDGHTRHAIWRESFENDEDREPEILELPFKDRDDAKRWILRTQLGRRNLRDADRDRLIAALYELRKGPRGGDRKSKAHGETMPAGDAAAQVAAETGVSRATVHRAVKRTAERKAAPTPAAPEPRVSTPPPPTKPARTKSPAAPTKPPQTFRTASPFATVQQLVRRWLDAKLRGWSPTKESQADAEAFVAALRSLADEAESRIRAKLAK